MRVMRKRMVQSVVVLVMLALLIVGPALGQASTQEAEPPVVVTDIPTDDGPPPVVVEQPDGFNVVEFLTGALVGTAATLATVFGIIGRLKNDQAALDAIEWLGSSIPADALEQINQLGKSLRDAGEVIDRVSDGLPNDPPAVG